MKDSVSEKKSLPFYRKLNSGELIIFVGGRDSEVKSDRVEKF
jgi:hypothetical protein